MTGESDLPETLLDAVADALIEAYKIATAYGDPKLLAQIEAPLLYVGFKLAELEGGKGPVN